MTELKHGGRATAQADSPKARRDLDWTVPNDPYFRPFEGTDQPCQWPLFLMNVPGAWEIEKGSSEVLVAVADDGVQIDHPDIANQVWTNPTPGKAGYADDIHGWDFRDGDNSVDDHDSGRPLLGPRGHGTHVAGIVAAEANNGIGIAGIAPGCTVLPIRLNAYDDHQMALAIRYALAYGVRVFNCNGAYYPPLKVEPEPGFEEFFVPPTRELAEACAEAYEKGMLLVFPAGGNRGARDAVTYPAVYEQVIQVAPCNMHGAPSNFAQVNPTVEVLAPGGERSASSARPGYDVEGVLSLGDAGTYVAMSGGCMCTPHASGVLALIVSRHPEWTAEEVRQVLRNTAAGTGWQAGRGHGLVDARRALEVDEVVVDLQVAAVRGWRLGATHAVRRDVSHLPIVTTAALDGAPAALQATVCNAGARDLGRALLFFFAGDPACGGQMIAVREFSLAGLESITVTVETAVAPGLDEVHIVLDALGAQDFAGRPYAIAKGRIAG